MNSLSSTVELYKPLGLKLFCAGIVLILSEFFYRVFLVVRDFLFHRRLYPKGAKLRAIITHAFFLQFRAIICLMAMLTLSASAISQCDGIFERIYDQLHLLPIHFIFRYLKLSESRVEQAERIRSGDGLDYGTGMASSYFHGYLNQVLPCRGDNNKGIQERITDYEDNHGVTFALKKLIIVVPDSLHTAPKIVSPYLIKAHPLETVIKGRAGVERPFKNDVYKFTERINRKVYYIAVEGATPLLSFKEAMDDALTGTPDMHAMQREILMQFYKSLQRYTSRSQYTRSECEIIYFPDENENGEPNDIGLYLKKYVERQLAGRERA